MQKDWGSVLSYDKTLPPSLPAGKATSLKEGGKACLYIPYLNAGRFVAHFICLSIE